MPEPRDFDDVFADLEFGDIDLEFDEVDLETPDLAASRFGSAEDDIEDYDFEPADGEQALAPLDAEEYGFPEPEGDEGSYLDDPAQDYWAREKEPFTLVAQLETKVEEFRNYQRSSAYWRWLIKNWQYAHNLYFDDQIDSIGVSALGEMGELVGYSVNHFRNLLQHLLTLTTRDRPAIIVRAKNSDAKSLIQSRLGKSIVESYFRDKRVEKYLKRAVEDSLVFAQGYVMVTWNPNIGEAQDATDEDGIVFEGDLEFYNPTAWDVFYDLGTLDWERQPYVIVRKYENKWDLLTRHPEHREAILAADKFTDNEEDTNRPLQLENEIYQETDMVETFHFYHKRTEALPNGRYVKYVPGASLVDTPNPYRSHPLLRITPGELLLSPFGYTPAFDLQAPQEIVNMEASSIASNHKSFGIQNVWTKTGDNVTQAELEGGLNHVQSMEPPQALQLTQTPNEIFKMMQMTIQAMEYLSGVNAVTRGQPEQALRAASGAALALIDAKAVQFASSLIQSYHQAIEDVGTRMIEILRDFASTERVISIIGQFNQTYSRQFRGEDLGEVDRVVVESTNPVLNTFAGRIDLADKLLNSGLLTTPQEYVNVIQTGQIESMLEAETAQLAKIRDENEALLRGEEVFASALDNHVLHIRECHALINSREASMNEELVSGVGAHIAQHIFMLEDLQIQKTLMVLGYPTPLQPTHVGKQALPQQLGTPPGAPAQPTGRPPTGGQVPAYGRMQPGQAQPQQGMEPSIDRRSTPRMPSLPAAAGGAPVTR